MHLTVHGSPKVGQRTTSSMESLMRRWRNRFKGVGGPSPATSECTWTARYGWSANPISRSILAPSLHRCGCTVSCAPPSRATRRCLTDLRPRGCWGLVCALQQTIVAPRFRANLATPCSSRFLCKTIGYVLERSALLSPSSQHRCCQAKVTSCEPRPGTAGRCDPAAPGPSGSERATGNVHKSVDTVSLPTICASGQARRRAPWQCSAMSPASALTCDA